MEETYEALLELQQLDMQMARAREQVEQFDPELEELEAPIAAADQEAEAVRKRLGEMKAEERRLERSANDKRAQLTRYEERLSRVRTAREADAARAEIDLIRGALEADEDDALALMDQIRRTELKLDEMEEKLDRARSEMAPKREELMKGREEAVSQLAVLEDRRRNQVIRLDPYAAGLYERIRAGKSRVALATLTPDGACGYCFSMVPIQEQNEIRRRQALHRCEACGVILYVQD